MSNAAGPGSASPIPPRTRPIAALRGSALALIFLGALFGSGLLFAKVRPFATVGTVREKFAHFAAHRDDYDTLFLGSSRVYRGIVPSVFDERTAALGIPTRSFNFGIDGMFPPEDAAIFEQIAALRPKKLRWVFFESSMFLLDFEARDPESIRAVYWHDWPRTRLVCAESLRGKKGTLSWGRLLFSAERERLWLLVAHVRAFVMRTLNLGRATTLCESWTGGKPPRPEKVLGRKLDGYSPMPERPAAREKELADFRTRLAQRRAKPARQVEMKPGAQASLDRMLSQARTLGAHPVVIISPLLGGALLYPRAASRVPVLDYTNLEKHAELFAEENRADASHLNPQGAGLYTRALADDFIELATRTASPR